MSNFYNNNSNKNHDLGYLGEDFQFKLVHILLEDNHFFSKVYKILDQNMFTNANLKVIVGAIKDYYRVFGLVPSYSICDMNLREIAKDDITRELYVSTLDKVKNCSCEGVDYISDLALRFFKQQNMIKVANKTLEMCGQGINPTICHQLENLFSEAVNINLEDDDLGVGIFDDLNKVLSEDARISIPTGIGELDDCLSGGLGKGELGVIIGPSSFGKTSLTTAIANYAATYPSSQNNYNGYKVVQIFFEDTVGAITRKHIARTISLDYDEKIESKDLSTKYGRETAFKRIENLPANVHQMLESNIRLKRYPSGERTVTDIKNYLKKLINSGFRPDMVIIDYFGCLSLKDTSGDSKWDRQEKVMRKIESMAAELNIAIWVPLQGTKDSVTSEIVGMNQSGGSFSLIQIAHIVLSVARDVTVDVPLNRATLALLKNRAGGAGNAWKNIRFNNGICFMSTEVVDDDFGGTQPISLTEHKQMIDNAQTKALVEIYEQVKEKNDKKLK